MKHYMTNHIETQRAEMFRESCDEVRTRLNAMAREVEELMANKADEVFLHMSRDYTEIVVGKKTTGEVMPKAERHMRAEVAELIQDREEANIKVEQAHEEASAVNSRDASANDENPDEDDAVASQLRAEVASDASEVATSSPGVDME